MSKLKNPNWDPRSDFVLQDQIASYDTMRKSCPVASGSDGYTYIFKHEHVLKISNDHSVFSSAVSRYPSVPNGMDPPEHTVYRDLINPYFSKESIDSFLPTFKKISEDLVASLPKNATVEFMTAFACAFAVHVQCAFLGWGSSLHQPLLDWIQKNHNATLSRDQKELNAVAHEFDGHIVKLLDERRKAGSKAPQDNTTKLINERVNGRLLTNNEIISILRNWTVGELGTISASVGILAHYFAKNQNVQKLCRDNPDVLLDAIDEILRIHPPLIMNRRIATQNTQIGGQNLEKNTKLSILWASANRDESVFGDPDEFRLDRDPNLNLLYGAGVHVCPGAYMSRQELLIITKELLNGTENISLDSSQEPVKAIFPASGFSYLPLKIVKP